jgi:hypothetical protein
MSCRSGQFFASLVILSALGMACGHTADECSRGDMSRHIDPALRDMLEEREWAWMRDATECSLGHYRVVAAASGQNDAIMVLRDQVGVFTKTSGSALMFKDGLPAVILRDGTANGETPSLSYDVHDVASGRRITVFDRDLDGQADIRSSYVKGQESTIELWRDGGWRTVIYREGHAGFVRDGQFTPLSPNEAQAKPNVK